MTVFIDEFSYAMAAITTIELCNLPVPAALPPDPASLSLSTLLQVQNELRYLSLAAVTASAANKS